MRRLIYSSNSTIRTLPAKRSHSLEKLSRKLRHMLPLEVGSSKPVSLPDPRRSIGNEHRLSVHFYSFSNSFWGKLANLGLAPPNPENLGSACVFHLSQLCKEEYFLKPSQPNDQNGYRFEEKLSPWNYFFLQIRRLILQNTIVICSYRP